MKRFALVLLAVVVLGAGAFAIRFLNAEGPVVISETKKTTSKVRTLGVSVEDRRIDAYTFGNGATHLTFIGGMHGGYEWNSVILAQTFIEYLRAHPEFVPKDIRITVIPNANPDGVFAVVGKEGIFTADDVLTGEGATDKGRFNARGVDLNRNFDCKW